MYSWKVDINSEKAMAPHSSTLAWKIPWMEEPGRLYADDTIKQRGTKEPLNESERGE